jgi:hypothetical protein
MTPRMRNGQRRPIREVPALLALLIMAAVVAGCASPVAAGPSATPTQSRAAAASMPAAARTITSRQYGYTETLPTGWRLITQATHRWDGKGAPSYETNVVDLFQGPGGVQAWADVAPTNKSLAAYTSATIRAARAGHPCSPPQTNQAITIGGAPARLLGMQCPPGSGFLVEIAVTIHHGTAFVFASLSPSGTAPTDRAAFHNFLDGIRFPR